VSTENRNYDLGETEVAALLQEFVKQNDGVPGKCTPNQKRQLIELAERHGRENFRAAARAWFKAPTWNYKTTDPFVAFISGFEGYAAKKQYDAMQSKKRIDEDKVLQRTTEWHRRKFTVDCWHGKMGEEFLASLTQEDRDYIKQVVDAKTLEELPPDNGRNYAGENVEFRKKQSEREQEAAKDF
jgi:hypothetical protein